MVEMNCGTHDYEHVADFHRITYLFFISWKHPGYKPRIHPWRNKTCIRETCPNLSVTQCFNLKSKIQNLKSDTAFHSHLTPIVIVNRNHRAAQRWFFAPDELGWIEIRYKPRKTAPLLKPASFQTSITLSWCEDSRLQTVKKFRRRKLRLKAIKKTGGIFVGFRRRCAK